MSKVTENSLRQLFLDLHAERVLTMAPEMLAINVNQRQTLVNTANRAGFVKKGDVVAPFILPEVEGSHIDLDQTLRFGPVVLIFFRFAGCPACNIAIPYYQRRLAKDLKHLGATLVAVSPQIPDRLVEIKRRHKLDFAVASDIGNALGRSFGILYEFDEPSRQAALAGGHSIGNITGTGTWELPMPAVVAIGAGRIVHFADVSPDWLVRTEAEIILDEVRALLAPQTHL